jgi:hypothetical protein
MRSLTIFALIMIIPVLCCSQAYQDTSYVIPSISGGINFSQQQDIIQVFTNQEGYGCGDGWDWFIGYYYASNSYISFNIITPLQGYHVQNVSIYLHLFSMEANDILGLYPIFNTSTGQYEPPCLIEHIDYGNVLSIQDINSTLLDPREILLSEYATGWVSHDITSWVLSDINQARAHTQLRIRLQNDSDWDAYYDNIQFHGLGGFTPYLCYTFEQDSTAVDEEVTIPNNALSCYPNPFKDKVTINYKSFSSTSSKLDIYNIKGQHTKTIHCNRDSSSNSIWDGNNDSGIKVTPGVYFVRLQSGKGVFTSKVLYLD